MWWQLLQRISLVQQNILTVFSVVAIMSQLPDVCQLLGGWHQNLTALVRFTVLINFSMVSVKLRIHFDMWWLVGPYIWYLPGIAVEARVMKQRWSSHGSLYQRLFLSPSRLGTNIWLTCRHFRLSSEVTRTRFVDHMHLCQEGIVFISFVGLVFSEK